MQTTHKYTIKPELYQSNSNYRDISATYTFGPLPGIKSKFAQDINDFHKKFGFDIGWTPTRRNLDQRVEMMEEEIQELKDAIEAKDKVGTVDAVIDLIYFALGTLDLLKVDTDAHWDAVQNANMQKVRGTKASRPNSGGFDVIKPDGWKPPEEKHKQLLLENNFEFLD